MMAARRKSFGKDEGVRLTKIENQVLPLNKIYTGAPASGIAHIPRATGSQLGALRMEEAGRQVGIPKATLAKQKWNSCL